MKLVKFLGQDGKHEVNVEWPRSIKYVITHKETFNHLNTKYKQLIPPAVVAVKVETLYPALLVLYRITV